jgi:hypothetical protein
VNAHSAAPITSIANTMPVRMPVSQRNGRAGVGCLDCRSAGVIDPNLTPDFVKNYKPNGLLGDLYWWAVYPVHVILFTGMLRAIGAEAERSTNSSRFPRSDRLRVLKSASERTRVPPARR